MDIIKKKLQELEELVNNHPLTIPLSKASKFIGMNEEGLKAALMRGNAPFGFGYQKEDGGYRVLVIPTVPFYLWYTNTNGQMILRDNAPLGVTYGRM